MNYRKNITSKILIASMILVLFSTACSSNLSISKRYHSNGFNFAWGGGNNKKIDVKTPSQKREVQQENNSLALAIATPKADKLIITRTFPLTTEKINHEAMSHKTIICNTANSIVSIGKKQISGALVASNLKTTLSSSTRFNHSKPIVKNQVQIQKKASGGGGKSQLIALLLCIFLGVIGIHRFYLGYTLEGVLQLLTGGGCGVWALIDLIRIITGDLQPKDGPYSEEL